MPRPDDKASAPPVAMPEGVSTADPTKPDPQFLELYSPNFEMPISWVSGILVVAMLFAAVVAIVALANREEDKSGVPIVLGPEGGDDPSGDGKDGGGPEKPTIADFNSAASKEDFQAALPENVSLPEVKDKVLDKLRAEDPDADVAISDKAAASYGGLGEELQKKLLGGGKPGPGTGSGGGDSGKEGNGGKGANSSRQRSLRWVLQFRTYSGRDYLDQLAALNAEVALPLPPDNNRFILYKNLKNPGKGEVMTQDQLVRLSGQIQFSDIRRESVRSVADALGVDFAPNSFWAFLPRSIEEELSRLEKGYNNRQPEDIAETKFQVQIVGGRYKFVVSEQTPKR